MKTFGEKLKELRQEKRLSQVDLAKLLYVSQATIADWERGITQTNFETLVKLADFFEVTADYLLGREDI